MIQNLTNLRSNPYNYFNQSQNRAPIREMNRELLLKSSKCLGADNLLKLLGNYCRNVDIKTSITVGVVGKKF